MTSGDKPISRFLETSAIVAILKNEPEREKFLDILQLGGCVTSELNLYESSLSLSKMLGGHSAALSDIELFASSVRLEVLPWNREVLRLAAIASDRYGKISGHKAKLNMGDCISYAFAKLHNLELVYKGNDFAQTDLA